MKQVARQQTNKNTPRKSEVHNSQQGLAVKIRFIKKTQGLKNLHTKKPWSPETETPNA